MIYFICFKLQPHSFLPDIFVLVLLNLILLNLFNLD